MKTSKKSIWKKLSIWLIILISFFSSGCSTITTQKESLNKFPITEESSNREKEKRGDCKIPLPHIFSGVCQDLQILLYPAICPGGGEGGLVFLAIWPFTIPFVLLDLPFSFAADILILPYTVYRQKLYGNIENAYEDPDEYFIRYNTERIKKNPNDASPYNSRGHEYYEKGKYKKAIADFSKSIEIAPNKAYPYFWRGMSWLKNGDYEKSIADFSKVKEIDPKFPYAYFHRAEAYAKLNQNKKAAEDYYKHLKNGNMYKLTYFKSKKEEIIKKIENLGYTLEYFTNRTKEQPDEGRKDVPVVPSPQPQEPVKLDTTVHGIKELTPAPRETGKKQSPGTSMKIYKWIDENGVAHYSDIQSQQSDVVTEFETFFPAQQSDVVTEFETFFPDYWFRDLKLIEVNIETETVIFESPDGETAILTEGDVIGKGGEFTIHSIKKKSVEMALPPLPSGHVGKFRVFVNQEYSLGGLTFIDPSTIKPPYIGPSNIKPLDKKYK